MRPKGRSLPPSNLQSAPGGFPGHAIESRGAVTMPEAVIVATGRTPIGRANKGSLVECRPDDLSSLVIKAVLDKVPAVASVIEDVIWGCGQPAGEAGTNVA